MYGDFLKDASSRLESDNGFAKLNPSMVRLNNTYADFGAAYLDVFTGVTQLSPEISSYDQARHMGILAARRAIILIDNFGDADRLHALPIVETEQTPEQGPDHFDILGYATERYAGIGKIDGMTGYELKFHNDESILGVYRVGQEMDSERRDALAELSTKIGSKILTLRIVSPKNAILFYDGDISHKS